MNAPSPAPLAERILDAFPSGAYALAGLLRLMDIVESDRVPTAAVECRVQPRMLVNPDFVARHAATPEKLLVLVMHELHHVLLGHTTLFARVTPARNFVFDAVINAMVCRMFPGADHTAFFTDYYDEASCPACLLRPPPGWPGATHPASGLARLPARQRDAVHEVHVALYSDTGASYHDVFSVLPGLLDAAGLDAVPLLGSHGEHALPDGRIEHIAPVLFDVVRGIVEKWPQPPDPIRGRSLADLLAESVVRPRAVPSNRQVLRGLLRKVAGSRAHGTLPRRCARRTPAETPIPGLARRSMVLRALGHEPLLHPVELEGRRVERHGERVHVYLDVSGSMDGVRDALYGAVLDCADFVHPVVHLFSTKVADLGLERLRRGECRSTGGTEIECVAEHMAAHRVRRALMVTDGWVGEPAGEHLRTLQAVRLAVALLGEDPNASDLAAVTDHSATLSLGSTR